MAVGTLAAAPCSGQLTRKQERAQEEKHTIPCRPLKISKAISLGRKGLTIMVTATKALPRMKMMRLPNRSAMRPHSSRKQAKVNEYAETIHWSRLSGMSSSLPMVGRMITMAWIDSVYAEEGGNQPSETRHIASRLTLRKLAPATVATSAMHRALEKGNALSPSSFPAESPFVEMEAAASTGRAVSPPG